MAHLVHTLAYQSSIPNNATFFATAQHAVPYYYATLPVTHFAGGGYIPVAASATPYHAQIPPNASASNCAMELVQETAMLEPGSNRMVGKQMAFFQPRPDTSRNGSDATPRPPRVRRTFKELQRELQCPHEGCTRKYASRSSLATHVRLKHSPEAKQLQEEIKEQRKKCMERQHAITPRPVRPRMPHHHQLPATATTATAAHGVSHHPAAASYVLVAAIPHPALDRSASSNSNSSTCNLADGMTVMHAVPNTTSAARNIISYSSSGHQQHTPHARNIVAMTASPLAGTGSAALLDSTNFFGYATAPSTPIAFGPPAIANNNSSSAVNNEGSASTGTMSDGTPASARSVTPMSAHATLTTAAGLCSTTTTPDSPVAFSATTPPSSSAGGCYSAANSSGVYLSSSSSGGAGGNRFGSALAQPVQSAPLDEHLLLMMSSIETFLEDFGARENTSCSRPSSPSANAVTTTANNKSTGPLSDIARQQAYRYYPMGINGGPAANDENYFFSLTVSGVYGGVAAGERKAATAAHEGVHEPVVINGGGLDEDADSELEDSMQLLLCGGDGDDKEVDGLGGEFGAVDDHSKLKSSLAFRLPRAA